MLCFIDCICDCCITSNPSTLAILSADSDSEERRGGIRLQCEVDATAVLQQYGERKIKRPSERRMVAEEGFRRRRVRARQNHPSRWNTSQYAYGRDERDQYVGKRTSVPRRAVQCTPRESKGGEKDEQAQSQHDSSEDSPWQPAARHLRRGTAPAYRRW